MTWVVKLELFPPPCSVWIAKAISTMKDSNWSDSLPSFNMYKNASECDNFFGGSTNTGFGLIDCK